jgi:hypothetical protein
MTIREVSKAIGCSADVLIFAGAAEKETNSVTIGIVPQVTDVCKRFHL